MKLSIFSVSRKRKLESRYHQNMGYLHTWVTYVKKTIFGVPFATLHKYRETYFGEIKDCKDCVLSRVKVDK